MTPDESHLYVPRHPPVKKGGVVQQPNGDWVSNARTAAEGWRAAMENRKRPCVMSPMDELTYCLDPVVTGMVLTDANPVQIVQANPQRLVLFFWNLEGNGGRVIFSPSPKMFNGKLIGTVLLPGALPIVIEQRTYLNLAQVAWYAQWVDAVGSETIYAMEVAIRDWPSDNVNPATPTPQEEGSPSPTGGSGLDPRWS